MNEGRGGVNRAGPLSLGGREGIVLTGGATDDDL